MRQWHPILTAREPEPGVWWLVDGDGQPYAIVEVVRRRGEVGYRVTTWCETLEQRRLVGYWRKLMPAMTAAHDRLQATISPPRRSSARESVEVRARTHRT